MNKFKITTLSIALLFSAAASADYTMKIPLGGAESGITFVSVIKEGSTEPVDVAVASSALCNLHMNELKAAVASSAYNEVKFLNDVKFQEVDENGWANTCTITRVMPYSKSAFCTGSAAWNGQALTFINNLNLPGKGILSITQKTVYDTNICQ